jgi:transcriptional regulator with XRE-family HTH domain
MSYINELLNEYMRANNYTQDKQVCIDLDVSKQYLSGVRKGKSSVSDENLIILSTGAGIDSAIAVAKFHCEWTKSDLEKSFWSNLAKKVEGLETQAASVFGALLLGVNGSVSEFLQCILC